MDNVLNTDINTHINNPAGIIIAGIIALAVPASFVWWVATTFATYKWSRAELEDMRAELKELEERQDRLETMVTAVQVTSASIQMELTYIRKGVDAVNGRIDRAIDGGVPRGNPQCSVASDKPESSGRYRYGPTDSQVRRALEDQDKDRKSRKEKS